MSEITDWHQLDRCEHCDGVLDCWTTRYTDEEAAETGIPGVRYRSEWQCTKCWAYSDRYHDENMDDILL